MGQTHAWIWGHPLTTPDKTAIRNATSVIMLRDAATAPKVLMGQRGASAAFMPNKFVFPGGALDPQDGAVPLACPLGSDCDMRLRAETDPALAPALIAAGIREVYEETGLILGQPGTWDRPAPQGWEHFAATGHLPSPAGFHFIFRAITPPGRPRRFDARFFLVEAEAVTNDLDDFSNAEDELTHLQWIPLPEVRQFNLPFITEVVLAEVTGLAQNGLSPASVPFFDNSGPRSLFKRLA